MTSDHHGEPPWRPTKILDVDRVIVGTSMRPALVMTDVGPAYLKPLAASTNPHALAAELIGTRIARLLGAPVPDCAVLILADHDSFSRGPGGLEDPSELALPGPAFCSRAMPIAEAWRGDPESLEPVVNPDELTTIVVVDTLLRNPDRWGPILATDSGPPSRQNYGNLLLVPSGGRTSKPRAVAIDFGEALEAPRGIPPAGYGIDRDKDERIYGLFPAFRQVISQDTVRRIASGLKGLDPEPIRSIVAAVPVEWDLSDRMRDSIVTHIARRAAYLADTIESLLGPLCGWPGESFN